jgi:hypothetical protein
MQKCSEVTGFETLTASDLAEMVLDTSPGDWDKSASMEQFPVWEEICIDHTELGEFEIWSTDSTPPPIKVLRAKPVDILEWSSSFSDFSGVLVHKTRRELERRILSGGLDEQSRPEAWKFLLGVYSWESTLEERMARRSANRVAYETYKSQWKSIVNSNSASENFKDNCFMIQKDVVRTDRKHPFYPESKEQDTQTAGDLIQQNSKLEMLFNILMTFTNTFPNGDRTFVQGMADLASTMLITMNDESDAFWSFVGLMNTFVCF